MSASPDLQRFPFGSPEIPSNTFKQPTIAVTSLATGYLDLMCRRFTQRDSVAFL
jgi:hypothetical protein